MSNGVSRGSNDRPEVHPDRRTSPTLDGASHVGAAQGMGGGPAGSPRSASGPPPGGPATEARFWPDGQRKVSVPFYVLPEYEEQVRRGEQAEREKRRGAELGTSAGAGDPGGTRSPADAVGYGRPPREHQFAPGQSGNPKGRPKGAKNKPPKAWQGRMLQIAQAEAFREIPVRGGEATVRIPLVQAVLRSAGVSALKGKVGAQRLMLEVAREAEATAERERREADRERQEIFELTFQRKEEARAEVARRKAAVAAGRAEAVGPSNVTYADDLLPHPDDLILDPVAGEVRLVGPLASDQREAWHAMLTVCDGYLQHVELLGAMLEASSCPKQRAALQKGIEAALRWLAKFRMGMPPWVDRRVNKDPPSLEEFTRAVRYLGVYLPPEP